MKFNNSLLESNHLMTALAHPSNNATLTAMYMIVYTTEILYLLMNITNYLKLQPDLILYLQLAMSIFNSYHFSFFTNSHSCGAQ